MPRSQKPRKRHNPGKTARQDMQRAPHIHQAYQTFAPLYQLLAVLKRGEIDAVGDRPIMQIWGGDRCEVCPALEGWVACWERIVAGESLPIDLTPLRQLYLALVAGELLTLELIQAAETVTDRCHAAYLTIPRERLISYSMTEQIQIELEASGIVQAADELQAA